MVINTIKIYCRLKPNSSNAKTEDYHIYRQPESCTDILTLNRLIRDLKSKKQEKLKFRFHKIFDEATTQEDIFETTAKPVIQSFVDGYNGTVFAYGQTGSGKTFTITGYGGRYEDRGIIPRTIHYIYQNIQQDSDISYTLYVSYLEIYNEHGFDLLYNKNDLITLEDLPPVTLLEDKKGRLHLRNLSLHQVDNEEDALNLLFLGDSNRMVSETPMNPHSSRSHCVFTIHLATRSSNTSVTRRSKLNIVDLAGSERVYKSQINGQSLVEARHINLSLHFLEQVILALGEPSRHHIPYRNSMMTSILRDSLGGNSLTVMIATLNLNRSNIDETVSTCRFAERVALVQNEVNLSEEMDPQEEIVMLRMEVQDLRSQVAALTREQEAPELTSSDTEECHDLVSKYLESEPGTDFVLLPNKKKMQFCFNLLKMATLQARQEQAGDETNLEDKYLRIIRQRDAEISILIRLLKKEKKRSQRTMETSQTMPGEESKKPLLNAVQQVDTSSPCDKKLNISKMDAFTSFMTNPVNTFEYDKCKLALKEKYKEAKDIAESIKKSQDVFKTSQETLQQTRNDEENRILKISQQNIDQEHTCYEKNLHRLRELKSETYHVKDELQKAKSRLLTKFQEWWKIQTHNGPTNSGADIIPSLHFDDIDELPSNKSSQYLCHSVKWEEEKPIKLNKNITSDTDRYQETQNKYMIDDNNKCATNSSTCLQKKIDCNVLLKNSVTEPMTYNGSISKTSVPDELVTGTTSQEFKCHSESGPDYTNDSSSVDRHILKINYSRSINSVNHAFSSKENNTMSNEKSEPSLYKSSNKWDNRPTYIQESDDTQPLSDERDSSVMKNLPLTGDPEIDEEIIAFYQARSKVVHG